MLVEEGVASQGSRKRGRGGSPRLHVVRKKRLPKAEDDEKGEAPQGYRRGSRGPPRLPAAKKERLPKAAGGEEGEAPQGCRR